MRFLKILFSIIFIVVIVFTLYIKITNKPDYEPPMLECDTDIISISVESDPAEILKHIKASDTKDGDLSENVIIESISPFVGNNNAKITFAVADSDNNVSKLEKQFLLACATRHYVFNYSKIADYYASASKEMQELMEDSALVIIDFDDAIAKGYVKLNKRIEDILEKRVGDN